jgi:hypothetical protein
VSVCMCLVWIEALRRPDPPSKESYQPTDYKNHNFIINSGWEQARVPNPSRQKKINVVYDVTSCNLVEF